jgi:acetyltransferase-like isoleucine patch superfamily enzyme
MVSNQNNKDIFERLRNGEAISSHDPEAYKLREASFATKGLLVQLNNAADAKEIRDLLSQITGSAIDESVAVFTPLYINYGKNTTIGKNIFINFDCIFLDLGGITIEDGVLIAPKVSLLTEGHPVSPGDRHSLVPGCRCYYSAGSNHWRKRRGCSRGSSIERCSCQHCCGWHSCQAY